MAETKWDFPDMFRLDGEVAVVTGGGAGIGRASAMMLAQAGAMVAVTDIDGQRANEAADAINRRGGNATAWSMDVGNEAAIGKVAAAVVQAMGRVDVLVNNAGVARRRATVEMSSDDWQAVFAVNVEGSFLCAREFGRQMLEQRGGRIVNVSSIMGLIGGGLYPNLAYNTSKGALVSMTRSLAAEWASMGVRVNAVAPTYVATELTAGLRADQEMAERIKRRTPLGRFAEAEEVAAGVLYLACRASSMVTGHVLVIDGGWLTT